MRTFFTLVLLAALSAAGWLAWTLWAPMAPQKQTFVLLHPGYSTRRIAKELRAAGVIRNADAFILWHYLHRQRSLKAGEYLFEKSASARDIHDRLARGEIYVQPSAARVLAQGARRRDEQATDRARYERLTDRERAVFGLNAEG